MVKSLYRAILPGLCLPLANYLVSFPTSLSYSRTLPNVHAQRFTKNGFCSEALGACPHIRWRHKVAPSFQAPRAFLNMYRQTEKFSLTSGAVILSSSRSLATSCPWSV